MTVSGGASDQCYFELGCFKVPAISRLRAVPFLPLEFVEPRKDIANAGARRPRRGKTREVRFPRADFSRFSCFSSPWFQRADVRDVFPRLDELKRKNRAACSLRCFKLILIPFGFAQLFRVILLRLSRTELFGILRISEVISVFLGQLISQSLHSSAF